MKLTADAAVDVCRQAARRGVVVSRIEGGIWHSPGFEARIDCIWDGVDSPVNGDVAEKNNLDAAEFVREESQMRDVFILSIMKMTGR